MFEFGPFTLDPAERHLLRDGEPVAIPPKAFDTLLALVENRGHAVKKDELIRTVWPDTFVEESNLTQYVSLLRKALGENGDGQRYIETVPRWGYRFVGEVRERSDERDDLTVHRRTSARILIRETEHDEPTTVTARPRRIAARPLAAGILVVAALAAALVFSSGRPERSAAAPDVRSIAVLPFTSMGAGAGDDAYLELGMADAVINRLGRLKRIRVRSTSAVRAYAGTAQDPVAVGRALKVDAILEGWIQKSGERIRVTVQLVSARDGAPMWTEKFDEDLGNVFGLEDAIAVRVARGLAPVLDGEEIPPARRPTDNPRAYEAYLKGRYFWSKRTPEGVHTSIDYFKQAIAEDPNFALAYAGLADAYAITLAAMAEPTLRRALELDDTLGEAHASLGFYLMFFQWNLPAADQEFRLAIALNPNYATAHQWYALCLAVRGHLEEAKGEMATAIECDPLSPNMSADMAQIYFFAGEYDHAIDQCRKALELDPNFPFAHNYLSAALARKGMYDEAVDEALWGAEHDGEGRAALAEARRTYAASGWRGFLRLAIARGRTTPAGLAMLYMAVGDTERAIEHLQQGCDERDFSMIFVGVEPVFAPLRSDPRFIEIERRIGVV